MSFTVKMNGEMIVLEKPTKVIELVGEDKHKYISCSVNNRIRELNYELCSDADVQLWTKKDQLAIKTYETSLRFITVMACSRVFPGHPVKLAYNMSRSIYLTFVNQPSDIPVTKNIVSKNPTEDIPVTKNNVTKNPDCSAVQNEAADESNSGEWFFDEEKLDALKKGMQAIIDADYPIQRRVMTKAECIGLYEKIGAYDKIDLLKYRPEETVHVNECDGYINYLYGHNVPFTGCIDAFRLTLYEGGVMIQYPRSEEKGDIPPFKADAVYGRTLRDSYLRAKLVGTDSIAGINHRVENDGPVDFIAMCEAYHNDLLAGLGREIYEKRSEIKLICIAGPSSSGKTTFANRLRIELKSHGMEPIRVSLDDYYLDRSKIPLDADGKPDFECLEALDLDAINRDMTGLVNGEEVKLPVFDFIQKKKVPGRVVRLLPGQLVIMEGIHALNNRLCPSVPRNEKYRIYIAPQAQINFDNHTPISLTDLRLLRRIVRDNQFRGTSAEQTIAMWPSVRRGEFRWIYDTQENADFVFNSLLPYEMCVLKKYAEPLVRAIDTDSPAFPLANRLDKFLKNFVDLDDKWVPCTSIMREFIGGSCFADV